MNGLSVITVTLSCMMLVSCMIVPAPTADELAALDNPPQSVQTKIDRLFPRALAWYERVEAELLQQGRKLRSEEVNAARKLGVLDPDRVRIVVLETFPMPEDDELRGQAERYGMGSSFEGGRTFGYAIMLKPEYADYSNIIRHELAHVAQHDRMGRNAFIRRYLVEMEMMGYSRSPLELEAYRLQ